MGRSKPKSQFFYLIETVLGFIFHSMIKINTQKKERRLLVGFLHFLAASSSFGDHLCCGGCTESHGMDPFAFHLPCLSRVEILCCDREFRKAQIFSEFISIVVFVFAPSPRSLYYFFVNTSNCNRSFELFRLLSLSADCLSFFVCSHISGWIFSCMHKELYSFVRRCLWIFYPFARDNPNRHIVSITLLIQKKFICFFSEGSDRDDIKRASLGCSATWNALFEHEHGRECCARWNSRWWSTEWAELLICGWTNKHFYIQIERMKLLRCARAAPKTV